MQILESMSLQSLGRLHGLMQCCMRGTVAQVRSLMGLLARLGAWEGKWHTSTLTAWPAPRLRVSADRVGGCGTAVLCPVHGTYMFGTSQGRDDELVMYGRMSLSGADEVRQGSSLPR